ncbi:MAG: pilus assembly PilX family protein [Rhodanobacteraceae bacterium]
MNAPSFERRARQHGVALLVGLVLLIVLSITALVAMQLVANQNRVAGNAWGSDMGRATGEGALGYAETQLLSGTVLEDFASDTNGAYTFNSIDVPQWAQPASTFAWTGSNVLGGASVFNNSSYTKSTATVIIEQLPSVVRPGDPACTGYGACNLTKVFRVTAKAVGPDGKLPVMLQDTSFQ